MGILEISYYIFILVAIFCILELYWNFIRRIHLLLNIENLIFFDLSPTEFYPGGILVHEIIQAVILAILFGGLDS